MWYSHKINAAGLRYEIAVSIQRAQIVSVNGPWPAGSYTDVKIFREGLKTLLLDEEFVIADNGYSDTRCLQPPGQHHPKNAVYRKIRSRHEVLNRRLKQFSILTQKFRHSIAFHGTCFHAVANITYLALIENPMFSIT